MPRIGMQIQTLDEGSTKGHVDDPKGKANGRNDHARVATLEGFGSVLQVQNRWNPLDRKKIHGAQDGQQQMDFTKDFGNVQDTQPQKEAVCHGNKEAFHFVFIHIGNGSGRHQGKAHAIGHEQDGARFKELIRFLSGINEGRVKPGRRNARQNHRHA